MASRTRDEARNLAAWFLGPKAENAELEEKMLHFILQDYFHWRRNYYPSDEIIITESLRRGFITAPLLMAGHAILELALIYAILLGLSPLLKTRWFFIAVSLAGGIILLAMARSLWRSIPTLKLVEANRGNKEEDRKSVV